MKRANDSASLDWTPPRAGSLPLRAWNAVRDVADAITLFVLILALSPFLWRLCRAERKQTPKGNK